MKILFVCTGNTCRSPMAKVLLEHTWKKIARELPALEVNSAGLAADIDNAASRWAQEVMLDRNLFLGKHLTKQVSEELVVGADLILTMTEAHRKHLLSLFPGVQDKCFSLRSYVGSSGDIRDPFGGDKRVYEDIAGELEMLVEKLALKLLMEGIEKRMKIAIGSDHAGYPLKEELKKMLEKRNIEYTDFGTNSLDSVDYPDFAIEVAKRVGKGEYDQGILVCGSGIGMSIAANKVPGVRAALCNDMYAAKVTRQHNDANVMAIGGRVVGPGLAEEILQIWLDTPYEGDRHARRVEKIQALEREFGRE